jgi:uncharacterized protein with HEPN domain
VTRSDQERLADIFDAIDAVASHLQRGGLDDGLVFDAVRLGFIEIEEAVERIHPVLLEEEPEVAWQDVAGVRDRLVHHYFDTSHAIVQATVDHDPPVLLAGAERLLRIRTV